MIALVCAAGPTRAAPAFDFGVLQERARQLAAQPYAPRPEDIPEWLRRLDYDQYRDIRFRPEQSWWAGDRMWFRLQFFPPGFIFNQTVGIAEVDDGRARPIPFQRTFFDYGHNTVGELPPDLGFAGFRILYPLNKPGDELGVFQGASYFRMLCRGAVYGLSARGLAVDTAEPTPEEFPSFEDFWVERPAPAARTITVYALLNGPSEAGAYRFAIAPGADTVVGVHAVVYCRKNPRVFGEAPLTSMFWHGKNTNRDWDDFRPEVHDSDGLMIHTGRDEWIWRPLTNPEAARESAFADDNPAGFGLVQRERRFDCYQDLEANYQLRPSAWVEPRGLWGRGSVRLVELPAPDETGDNIVAFWVPERMPPPGEPITFDYDLHWYLDGIGPPGGAAVATRHGHSRTQEPDLERFVVDFDGSLLRRLPADAPVEADVSVGDGAALAHPADAQKNPNDGSWRAAFALRPDGSKRPVELRCTLRDGSRVLTETWSYLWQP